MTSLKGACLLIVEDETLIALDIEDMFVQAGADVVCVTTIDDALPLARVANFNAALLDVWLCGRSIAPVAAELAARGIPFVFYSGHARAGVDELQSWPTAKLVRKPTTPEILIRTVVEAMACRESHSQC